MQNYEIPNAKDRTWWQRNKKKVLMVGGIAGAAVGGVLLYKNWDTVKELAMMILGKEIKPSLQPVEVHVNLPFTEAVPDSSKPILAIINGGEAFSVNGHVRNLPASWTPSPEQRALAESLGISLGDHQTYVRDYLKNCA